MEKNVLNTDLSGKVAVVTGASGTLCSIFAKALARAGAKVALLGRNMEITVNMMRELSLGYVHPVDPDKLMEGAAEGMVSDLDPYTEFIPEDQMSNFELLTTGKYGGVGSLIRKKGDGGTIAPPHKRSPPHRARR